MTEQKKTRSELKREAIIEGAMQAFQQYGVNDTSMDKIAETAQVSKRTVYNHFATKEILVTHIVTEIWRRNMVDYDVSFDADGSIRAQLLELVLNELKMMDDAKLLELVRVAIGYCLFSADDFIQQVNKLFEQETAIQRWLRAASENGALQIDDLNLANEQLISLLKGQVFWPQVLKQKTPLEKEAIEQIANTTVDMFLGYYQR